MTTLELVFRIALIAAALGLAWFVSYMGTIMVIDWLRKRPSKSSDETQCEFMYARQCPGCTEYHPGYCVYVRADCFKQAIFRKES